MATVQEIEQGLQQDETFMKLIQSDPEAATKFAEEAFSMADDQQPANPTETATSTEPQAGPVRTYVRPVLEAAGMAGGALLGAGATLPSANPFIAAAGAAGGAILGGAGGAAVADIAEQVAGEQVPPQDMGQVEDRLSENLQTGFMGEIGGQVLNLGVKTIQTLKRPFADGIDATKQQIVKWADEMGVKLSPGDITGSHSLSMFIEGVSERTPFSAGDIHKFRLEGLKKLVERRNELLERGGTPDSIEETGRLIQDRVKNVADELGVTNTKLRQELIESTVDRLGSNEPYEALGLTGQKAVMEALSRESSRVSGLYTEASNLAPKGTVVKPTNLNKVVDEIAPSYMKLDPSIRNPQVEGWLRQFKGSGNQAYDAQQAEINGALTGVPERLKPKIRQQYMDDLVSRGMPIEQPGYDPDFLLNTARKQLNQSIDALDPALQLTGQVGVKGMGKPGDNAEKAMLLKLKAALDADVKAYSDSVGGNFKGALETARGAAGDFKNFASSDGVKNFLAAQPQEAARMLAQSKDLQAIRQLRTVLGDKFKPAQDAFANEILGVGRGETIGPSFLRGQLRKYQKGVAEAMLGEGRVRQIRNLADQLETQDAAAITNPFFKKILRADPRSVVDLIVKPQGVMNLKFVERELGADALKDLSKGLVNKILQKPTSEITDSAWMMSPAKLLSGLKQYGDETLAYLTKHDPKFLPDLKKLVEVSHASQGASKMASNPSGTGQSLIAFGAMNMLINNPLSGIRVVLGIPVLTKIYMSPTGRKWLTEGFKTNPNSPLAGEVFGKILAITVADEAIPPPPQAPQPSLQQLSSTELALSGTNQKGRTGNQLPSFSEAR